MNERNLPILRADATASLCSICPDPGHCCRRFHFHKTYWKDEGLEVAQRNLIKWNNQLTFIHMKTMRDSS